MVEFHIVAKKFSLRCQYLYHQLDDLSPLAGGKQALSQKLRMDLKKLN